MTTLTLAEKIQNNKVRLGSLKRKELNIHKEILSLELKIQNQEHALLNQRKSPGESGSQSDKLSNSKGETSME